MSTAPPPDTDLHLPDLRFKGFRGIRELTITRLGRVTLLAGKNGTGKILGQSGANRGRVALALANSKDGFLLIDEAENGIHHSIQRDFWTMILKAAHQNNVQVLATTHSWDCVAGFAMAATEIEEVDGALVRLDRYDDRIRAVEYTEDDLRVAAKHGIEVR